MFKWLASLREEHKYKKMFNEAWVLLYHAKAELGEAGWLKVMQRKEANPTVKAIIENLNNLNKGD
jgi:hypothetical protein